MIRAVIVKEKPDLIVLQEIKKEVVDRRFISSIWKSRFVEWVILPALGRSGGILIMWDPRFIPVKDNLIGEFSASIKIPKNEFNFWWITAVYGLWKPSLRNNFWDELAGLRVLCDERWCLGSDFNVVRTSSEKMNSHSQTSSMRCFDSLIQELELCDPPLLNGKFTWSNLRDMPICCRLDRFMFTTGWTEFFPFNRQTILPRITSDNFPVVLEKIKWGPTAFRFENVWVREKNFKSSASIWWDRAAVRGWEGYKFMMKLKSVKMEIKRWNKEVYGMVDMRMGELRRKISVLDELESDGLGSEEVANERKENKMQLEDLICRQNRIHYQKSKIKWVKEGDQNTKFFHSLLNQRRSKATINRLEREDGSITSDEDEIVAIILRYFEEFYGKKDVRSWGIEGVEWCLIDDSMSRELEKFFKEDEIKSDFRV
ncbi:uncharacterized protein [Primulina eburnea]|uniref:uncharacterized protein n=1 Tax=Primulina eburnea TaxID=1245227 RepID=UPI003C6C74B7